MQYSLQDLAARILRAQDTRSLLAPFSSTGLQLSMREAYEVSLLVHEARLKIGWKPVGRKIGFTNKDMWALFGVHQPVWSFVYDATCADADEDTHCLADALVQPRIEPEIVLSLRRTPPAGASAAEVLACVDWVSHSIEMVQCHYPDWKFSAPDAVCDASFHGRLLLGERRLLDGSRSGIEEMLKTCEVSLFRDGELIETAPGRHALGSPLLAVAALVDAIALDAPGYPLQPGELITTGTLTKAYPVKPGERWQTHFGNNEFPGLNIEFR